MTDVSLGVIVIGDDRHSLEIMRAIEAANHHGPQVVILGCGTPDISPSLSELVLRLECYQVDDAPQWGGMFTKHHPQPHYRMNYRTGKPLRF